MFEASKSVSSPAARFGATNKPLADGAPSGPGSDRSHDRKGATFLWRPPDSRADPLVRGRRPRRPLREKRVQDRVSNAH